MRVSVGRLLAVGLVPIVLVACLAVSASGPVTSDLAPAEAVTAETASRAEPVQLASASQEASAATVATVSVPEPVIVPKAALPTGDIGPISQVWQSLNNCGPATVVMALSTLGVTASQEDARLALRGTDVRRGMGPGPVGPWVEKEFGLRSTWRSNGTNELMKALITNGFAPMVTQWMEDPWISRISHWRVVRGYDDARGTFYVNDPIRGRGLALSYDWFGRNWQPFSYRYMVVYRPADEPLLRAVIGHDWNDKNARRSHYDRAKAEALRDGTSAAWLGYGEAAYQYGMFEEAIAASEKGMSLGSATGVFMLRSSLPNAYRALGRSQEADAAQARLANITPGISPAAAPLTATTTFRLDPAIAAIVAERERDARAAALAERRLRLKLALD